MKLATVTTMEHEARHDAVVAEHSERVAGLVRSAAAGDREAWETLVAEFEFLVLGVARGHGLTETDAADVAQTTWLRLIEHLGRLHDPERVGSWLATTAYRESLRLLQRQRRQVLTPRVPEAGGEEELDQRLLREERDAAVRTAFRRLRSSDQALLGLLVADSAPSYEQIGRILHMPIGSIGPTRARSLTRLRREAALVGLTDERRVA